ncbi:glycosyl transferase family 2 [Aphanothece hegewaldii CCALA 016]|uniref:Glycosyl transferase family 2 n=1 Tax=Aphanothece hegewaldii CCALA 016 TaxID=2107694 RepID=A0A2T1LTK4_9CHRO|nr:glycosyltransferase family 2 protein [Aphanothece hegewaldii]PSF34243.1 glycosyl transferase family 2 [Aphanothece hegewaldii CCALA 016]
MLPQKSLDLTSSLLIVIVNYRTPQLTIDCLKSLYPEVQAIPRTQVIVVDNNSGDRSVEQIQETINIQGWNNWVSILASNHNGGFAFGNNLAIRPILNSASLPAYFLLLNPDTIVLSGALTSLVTFMNEHPKVGIAGSRLESNDGTIQPSAFRFHSIASEFDRGLQLGIVTKLLSKWVVARAIPTTQCQTDWVSGASLIIRPEVFESVGLMDEDYFMYYEEVDFCLQAKKMGWSCWYVPESRVIHLVGQSSGVDQPNSTPKRLPQYWFDSRRRYFIKNHGWWYAALADFLWLFGFISWKIRSVLQRKPDLHPPYLLKDFWQNSVFVTRLIN